MNSQEIFTNEERDENANRKRELVELVASGEAVLIVGAGSSARLGYPDWHCLLKKLEDLAHECGNGFEPDEGKREKAPLAYAEEIKSHICRETGDLSRYYNLLDRLFRRNIASVDDLHNMLVSLPFKGILTTNFDFVLETALAAKEEPLISDNSLVIDEDIAAPVHEFLMAMVDTSAPRRIAHLHGRCDNPKSIILSRKDYHRVYEGPSVLNSANSNQAQRGFEWTLHRKLLWAILATRRVVFVGFSMRDPYLNEMLYLVSKDLWRWDKSTHYAIMALSPQKSEFSKAKELKRDYGIDTVFYENADSSHLGLDRIVAEIANKCGIESQPPIDLVDVHPGIEEAELDRLEQMNLRMDRRMGDEN